MDDRHAGRYSALSEFTDPEEGTTWAPVPLAEVVSGGYNEPEPAILARSDGRGLIYPGRIHAIHAEPEALKSWLALQACVELLWAGECALYIDFEDHAAAIVSRLLALGADPEAIVARFLYVRPDEPLGLGGEVELGWLPAFRPVLAVIDGVTEAFSCQGLSPLVNEDVARWLDVLPRRLVRAGAAVLLLDHVVKDREQRGRYAIGAQHKLAGVDVAYSLRVLEPFARGRDGLVSIRVEKDRPGRVREFAVDGKAALVNARSKADGAVTISLEPPDGGAVAFRPTVLMERVSNAVETDPGLSKRAIRDTVRGKASAVDLALELLIAEGFVDPRRDGTAVRHYPVKLYREAEDKANRVSAADRVPSTGTRSSAAHAETAQVCPTASDHGKATSTRESSNRVPVSHRVPTVSQTHVSRVPAFIERDTVTDAEHALAVSPADLSLTGASDVTGAASHDSAPPCAYSVHEPDWKPHPLTRRIICWVCHPPAVREAA